MKEAVRIVLTVLALIAGGAVHAEKISILGMTLGEPIPYPACEGDPSEDAKRREETGACWFPPERDERVDMVMMVFRIGALPDWMVEPVGVLTLDERVVGVNFKAWPTQPWEDVVRELSDKFGGPEFNTPLGDGMKTAFWETADGTEAMLREMRGEDGKKEVHVEISTALLERHLKETMESRQIEF